MHIMFILIALPLVALPVFWFLPAAGAVPIYVVCVSISAWLFWLMRRNRRYRVVTGREGMIGEEAEIVSRSVSWGRTKYMIQVEGELWTVLSKDNLQPGNRVIITALRGNTPVVERKDTSEVM